jgi:hypothetical protein
VAVFRIKYLLCFRIFGVLLYGEYFMVRKLISNVEVCKELNISVYPVFYEAFNLDLGSDKNRVRPKGTLKYTYVM